MKADGRCILSFKLSHQLETSNHKILESPVNPIIHPKTSVCPRIYTRKMLVEILPRVKSWKNNNKLKRLFTIAFVLINLGWINGIT